MGANTSEADILIGLGRGRGRGRGRGSSPLIKKGPDAAGYIILGDFYLDSPASGTVFTITPTGTIFFSGQSSWTKERKYNITGNITFSGTAPVTFVPFGPTTYTITPTGSVVFSGNVVMRLVRAFPAGGTLVFSGTQALVKTKVQAPTGSISFTGSLSQIRTKVVASTGSLEFNGTAPLIFNGGSTSTVSTWRALTGTGL